jgi:hypothetical protein
VCNFLISFLYDLSNPHFTNQFCRVAVAEPDKKLWGGRNRNKLKYINHII